MRLKKYMCIVLVFVMVGMLAACGANKGNTTDNDDVGTQNQTDEVSEESEDESDALGDIIKNTDIPGKCVCSGYKLEHCKGTDVSYYYNIDTSKFDKSKFDGNISFWGVTVAGGKLTTARLKKLGINTTFGEQKADGAGASLFSTVTVSLDTTNQGSNLVNMNYESDATMCAYDFTGGTDIYSENTYLSSYQGYDRDYTNRNVYPAQLGVADFNEINIDLVLDKLGNPTFVADRGGVCPVRISSTGTSSGPTINTYTEYIYVYDNITFRFCFSNWQGMKLEGIHYYPTALVPVDKLKAHQDVYESKIYSYVQDGIDSEDYVKESNESIFKWDGTKIVGFTDEAKDYDNVVIPKKCTSVASLSNNPNLKTIEFANPNTTIESSAFIRCSKLERVKLPSELTSLKASTFKECRSLKSVTMPDSITIIGENAFESCISLERINIPTSTTYISDSAFKECTSLKSVIIPDRVKIIGNGAFLRCKALEIVIFGKGLVTIKDNAFLLCDALKEVKLQEGITSIGASAFANCKSLQSIHLPASVKKISGTDSIKQTHKFNVYVKKDSYADRYINSLNNNVRTYINTIYQ